MLWSPKFAHTHSSSVGAVHEQGIVTIFWDVYVSSVQNVFDTNGSLLDTSFLPRIDKFLKELTWVATTLRYGRENITLS